MIELQRIVTPGEKILGVDCTLILSLNAEMITVTAPWDEPFDLGPYVTPGKRTFITSTLGEVQGRWCDGPLVHVLENGLVASYVPAGGVATLSVPSVTSADAQGVAWEAARSTEGAPLARSQRCLIGLFDERAKAFGDGVWRFTAERLDLVDALALVLLRQASPRTEIRMAMRVQSHNVPPHWRRLLQNVGVWLDADWDGQGDLARLEAFADEIPAALRPELARHLNVKSDVLPKRLEESRCAF